MSLNLDKQNTLKNLNKKKFNLENENIIEINKLTKIYKIPKKQKNISKWKARFSWIVREWEDKIGIENLTFNIKKGELLGFIGENGSGKSTTIKMLTSILYPTSGSIKIHLNGKELNPQKNRIEYTKNIGVVFGQRSILAYDIPVKDSFRLFKEIYELSEEFYQSRLKYLIKMLGIDKFFETPYRMLSLGEKMRCELAASFLHKPKIVFLDEPTIGLDANAKVIIRTFLKEINETENVTIILTTHDMNDIEELCTRIVLIDKGEKFYDGNLKNFIKKYANKKNVSIYFSKITNKLKLDKLYKKYGFEKLDLNLKFKIKSGKELGCFLKDIYECGDILDINLEDEKIENILVRFYKKNKK
jgi:ABC-2 type transport system ATP-binding protein